jgi:hypothetical protein
VTREKLSNPTIVDILLSLFIPGWGFIVGIIALFKREWKRGMIMLLISIVVIWLLVLIGTTHP